MPEAKRQHYLKRLLEALDVAETPRDIASIVKTASALDKLNLDWLEYDEKLARLESGDATEVIELVIRFDSPAEEAGRLAATQSLPEAEGGVLRQGPD